MVQPRPASVPLKGGHAVADTEKLPKISEGGGHRRRDSLTLTRDPDILRKRKASGANIPPKPKPRGKENLKESDSVKLWAEKLIPKALTSFAEKHGLLSDLHKVRDLLSEQHKEKEFALLEKEKFRKELEHETERVTFLEAQVDDFERENAELKQKAVESGMLSPTGDSRVSKVVEGARKFLAALPSRKIEQVKDSAPNITPYGLALLNGYGQQQDPVAPPSPEKRRSSVIGIEASHGSPLPPDLSKRRRSVIGGQGESDRSIGKIVAETNPNDTVEVAELRRCLEEERLMKEELGLRLMKVWNQVTEYQKEAHTAVESAKKAAEDLQQAQKEVEAQKAVNAGQEEHIASLIQQIDAKVVEVENVRNEMTKANNELVKLHADYSKFRSEVRSEKSDAASLRKEIEKEVAEIWTSRHTREIDEIKESLKTVFNKTIDDTELKYARKTAELETSHSLAVEQLERKLEVSQQRCAEYEEKLRATLAKSNELEKIVRSMQNEDKIGHEALADELAQERVQCRHLQLELTRVKGEVETLRAESAATTATHAADIRILRKERDNLKDKLQQEREDVEKEVEEARHLKKKAEDDAERISKKEEHLDRMESILSRFQKSRREVQGPEAFALMMTQEVKKLQKEHSDELEALRKEVDVQKAKAEAATAALIRREVSSARNTPTPSKSPSSTTQQTSTTTQFVESGLFSIGENSAISSSGTNGQRLRPVTRQVQ